MAEGNSPSDQINEYIKKMVTHEKNESRRQGKSAELLPAHLLRAYHRITRARNMANVFTPNYCENQNFHFSGGLNNTISPSRNPFLELKRTVIPDLKQEESATKKYIIARIIEEGYVVNGYHTVIEDHAGNVCNLLIHNFPLEELTGSIGIALIIKEPYFKIDMQGSPYIRCDCPTDIFILRPCFYLYHLNREIAWKNKLENGIVHDVLKKDFEPEDPGHWCARGDLLIYERQLAAAREAYRLGTRCCGRDDPYYKTLRFKLLDLHLLLNWYEWTINACRGLLEQFPDDRDTLFHLGQSYYKARNYRRALTVYEKYCALFSGDQVMETQLLEVKERIQELNGVFNIERLRRISVERPFDSIVCAEYFGPIEIMKIPGKGRGMVLTKDTKKGDILFVSKALVTCYPRQKPQVAIGENNKEEDQLDPASSENIRKLTHLVYKNPKFFGAAVFNLFAGEHPFKPIQQFCYPVLKKEAICDVEKIRAIYKWNKFVITGTVNGVVVEKGEGLFLFASYLNHNCSPNVEIEFYNDIMVARAKMNLKSDTELAISYVPPNIDVEKKKKMLQERGIITCLCTQCKQRH